jgi:hypothetical protein
MVLPDRIELSASPLPNLAKSPVTRRFAGVKYQRATCVLGRLGGPAIAIQRSVSPAVAGRDC